MTDCNTVLQMDPVRPGYAKDWHLKPPRIQVIREHRNHMPRFAANLSMLYNEHAFLDRFTAAAQDGFRGVEYLFPYAFPAQALQQQ